MTTTTETDPDIRYVYGWGRTKHIQDPHKPAKGLCGATGGNSWGGEAKLSQRPVCKNCARMMGIETPEQELERLTTWMTEHLRQEPRRPGERTADWAIRLLLRDQENQVAMKSSLS